MPVEVGVDMRGGCVRAEITPISNAHRTSGQMTTRMAHAAERSSAVSPVQWVGAFGEGKTCFTTLPLVSK